MIVAAIVLASSLAPVFGGLPASDAAPPIAPEAEAPLTLARAVEIALAANPDLAAARLARPVALAEIDLAGARPNPDLAFEETRETPHDALTLSLPIETAGKRGRRLDLARAGAAAGEAEIARFAVEVRDRVRRAFYGLLAAERRVAASEELARLAGRARDAARDRFTSGDAPRLEALQAELDAAAAESEAESARGGLAAARAGLDVALGRPPGRPIEVAGGLAAGEVPETSAATDRALGASVALALLDRQVEAAAARVELARSQLVPDPTLDLGLTRRSPPEFDLGWRAGISLTLPLSTGRRAEVRVEEASLAQLHGERSALAARIAGDVFAAVAVAGAAQARVRRFEEEILPRAAEVEAMAEDSYRSGQTSLVSLLESLRASHDLRLAAVEAGYDFQLALADLEHAIGAPLP